MCVDDDNSQCDKKQSIGRLYPSNALELYPTSTGSRLTSSYTLNVDNMVRTALVSKKKYCSLLHISEL